MDDIALLQEYARTGAEAAFATLVERHLGLVYSAACRQVRDPQHAQDVTQAVFIVLARKSRQVARHPSVSGWLLQTTRYVASAHIRTAVRRARREQEAAMQSPSNDSSPAAWTQLEAHLDEAMASLGATDRAVLTLRYFENKTAGEAGQVLKLSEAAAKKRANRAVEKLRRFFARQGIVLSAGAIAGAVSANAVQAVPAGLAAAVTTTVFSGTALTSVTLLAATQTITMTTFQKIAVSAALTATVSAGIYEASQAAGARAQMLTLQQQQARLSEQVQDLQSQRDDLASRLAAATNQPSKGGPDDLELYRLRGEVGALQSQAAKAGQQAQMAEAKLKAYLSVQAKFKAHETAEVNALKMLGLTMKLYADTHGNQYPTNYEQFKPQIYTTFGYSSEVTNSFSVQGVDLYGFEFVNPGVLTNAANPEYPNLTVMRERIARQAPDGSWSRIYGLADGSVQTATSYDGNFDAWEKANTYLPPANQTQ